MSLLPSQRDALRAQFAGQALAGLLSQTEHSESGFPVPRWPGGCMGPSDYGDAARTAVKFADALLAELEKQQE